MRLQTDELTKRGVDKVLCVTPSTPDAIEELRAREDLRSPKVRTDFRRRMANLDNVLLSQARVHTSLGTREPDKITEVQDSELNLSRAVTNCCWQQGE
eukprot:scaffold76143_cov23-Tisochrysis_lutea.AAC.2